MKFALPLVLLLSLATPTVAFADEPRGEVITAPTLAPASTWLAWLFWAMSPTLPLPPPARVPALHHP